MSNEIASTTILEDTFKGFFGHLPSVHSVAPGRVNIIGEHTDYNEGFVLPVALQFNSQVLLRRRDDTIINLRSLEYPEQPDTFELPSSTDDTHSVITPGKYAWANYIRGIVCEILKTEQSITGFDLLVTSSVPQGSGLSSSAALEVSIVGALNNAFGLELSLQDIALIGQATENNFIDCQCGIMDQLISATGQKNHAIMIDCADLTTQSVSVPDDLAIVIINSNYPRKLADSEYNERREACNLAASVLGVSSLRHASMRALESVVDQLDDVVYRRAKHVISENQRVSDSVKALNSGDIDNFYKLMSEGQISLQDDFEITVPATEKIVQICLEAVVGKAGVRQTGGGFGGAIVCVCAKDDVAKIKAAVDAQYFAATGLTASVYVCEASAGLQVTQLG